MKFSGHHHCFHRSRGNQLTQNKHTSPKLAFIFFRHYNYNERNFGVETSAEFLFPLHGTFGR
jgi:hypothetical protein